MDLTILADPPDRLDDRALALVDQIATTPLPAPVASDHRHFLQCMRTLSILPVRDGDETSARLRLRLYQRHFGHQPRDALNWLTEQATLRCKFFPTPAECQAILDDWRRRDPPLRARQQAIFLAHCERTARFDEAMTSMRLGRLDQRAIDALPEWWQRIGETRGYLRRQPDGTYTARQETSP